MSGVGLVGVSRIRYDSISSPFVKTSFRKNHISTMRRICIFSFYDEHGIVDDYVIYFLAELNKFVGKTIFYSNGPLTRDSEIALRGVVDEVLVRPNEGFDVLA